MTAAAILTDLTTRGVRIWADADRLKLDAPTGILTDDDKTRLAEHKPELLELLASTRFCSVCGSELRLQDRAADAWWCPSCRLWSDGQGRPLAQTEKPKPALRDEEKARQLIEDLKAAGCAFVIEDGELHLRFPSRMSAALWTRFENAGEVFRAMAKEEAERERIEVRCWSDSFSKGARIEQSAA
jgi:hypothetical protein